MRSWSSRSRSPSGSSSRSAFGFVTSTRASATRCCWPPESCARLAVGELVPRPTISSASPRLLRRARLVDAVHLQPELDVLEHRPVREEREVLEDGGRRPLVRARRDERLAVEEDVALGRVVVAADHAQRRRLAAARRAEQDDVLAVVDVEVDVVDRDGAAGEDLRDAIRSRPELLRVGGGGGCRPLRDRLVRLPRAALGAEELVELLHLVDVLREERVPGRVLARALGERAAVALLALLDVADAAGDARQVARRRPPLYQKWNSSGENGGLAVDLALLERSQAGSFLPLAM